MPLPLWRQLLCFRRTSQQGRSDDPQTDIWTKTVPRSRPEADNSQQTSWAHTAEEVCAFAECYTEPNEKKGALCPFCNNSLGSCPTSWPGWTSPELLGGPPQKTPVKYKAVFRVRYIQAMCVFVIAICVESDNGTVVNSNNNWGK